MSHCFFDAADKPAIVFPPNSSLKSEQKTEVLTSASGPHWRHFFFGRSKQPHIAHGQRALCFGGFIA